MNISRKSEKEFVEIARSQSLRKDMEIVVSQRHNPFIKEGAADPDTYIEFVVQYNEFINHEPKPFKRIVDGDMRL